MEAVEMAVNLLRSIEQEEAMERSIPNDAAWSIIEEAESLAQKVIEDDR